VSKEHIINDIGRLETLYGEATPRAITKELRYLNSEYRTFVEAAPFMAVATVGSEGLDCSPRGIAAVSLGSWMKKPFSLQTEEATIASIHCETSFRTTGLGSYSWFREYQKRCE